MKVGQTPDNKSFSKITASDAKESDTEIKQKKEKV